MTLKYSFNNSDFRNLKGKIAEMLVHRYIEKVSIPSLKDKWDEAIFTPIAWFGDEEEQNKNRPPFSRIYWKHEEKFFISKNLYPTPDFLGKFKLLTKTLENVPDGFLFKIKEMDGFKTLKEALVEFNLSDYWEDFGYTFNRKERSDDQQFAIIDGEIEIVEVKSDESNLPPHQRQSYTAVLNEGFALRFFHVDLSTFAKNEFEVSEKLITKLSELKTFPCK